MKVQKYQSHKYLKKFQSDDNESWLNKLDDKSSFKCEFEERLSGIEDFFVDFKNKTVLIKSHQHLYRIRSDGVIMGSRYVGFFNPVYINTLGVFLNNQEGFFRYSYNLGKKELLLNMSHYCTNRFFFNESKQEIIIGYNNNTIIYNYNTRKKKNRFYGILHNYDFVSQCIFVSYSSILSEISLFSKQPVIQYDVSGYNINMIDFTKDYVIAKSNKAILIFKRGVSKPIHIYTCKSEIYLCRISYDSRFLVFVSENKLFCFSLSGCMMQFKWDYTLKNNFNSVIIQKKTIIAKQPNKMRVVLDFSTGAVLQHLGSGRIFRDKFDYKLNQLALLDETECSIHIFKADSHVLQFMYSIDIPNSERIGMRNICFYKNQLLIANHNNGDLETINLHSGKRTQKYVGDESIRDVEFLGADIFTVSWDGTVKLFRNHMHKILHKVDFFLCDIETDFYQNHNRLLIAGYRFSDCINYYACLEKYQEKWKVVFEKEIITNAGTIAQILNIGNFYVLYGDTEDLIFIDKKTFNTYDKISMGNEYKSIWRMEYVQKFDFIIITNRSHVISVFDLSKKNVIFKINDKQKFVTINELFYDEDFNKLYVGYQSRDLQWNIGIYSVKKNGFLQPEISLKNVHKEFIWRIQVCNQYTVTCAQDGVLHFINRETLQHTASYHHMKHDGMFWQLHTNDKFFTNHPILLRLREESHSGQMNTISPTTEKFKEYYALHNQWQPFAEKLFGDKAIPDWLNHSISQTQSIPLSLPDKIK